MLSAVRRLREVLRKKKFELQQQKLSELRRDLNNHECCLTIEVNEVPLFKSTIFDSVKIEIATLTEVIQTIKIGSI